MKCCDRLLLFMQRSMNCVAGPENQVVCCTASGVYRPRSLSHRPVSRHSAQLPTASTIAA